MPAALRKSRHMMFRDSSKGVMSSILLTPNAFRAAMDASRAVVMGIDTRSRAFWAMPRVVELHRGAEDCGAPPVPGFH